MGYVQHTSPIRTNTDAIPNVLIRMKLDNKSTDTIDFTRKALTFIGKHTSLREPEAVKMFIANLEASSSYKKLPRALSIARYVQKHSFPERWAAKA